MRAYFVRSLDNFIGDAELYRVDPPAAYDVCENHEYVERHTEYVIVSAATLPLVILGMETEETYIFPANDAGEVIDWGELPGSFKGARDIPRALEGAGYEIVRESP